MSPPRRFAEIAGFVTALEGWMTPAQGERLFEAARRCPPEGRIVEIGSFRGKSTVVLALAADASVEVIAIDPHAGTDRGPQEIEGYAAAAADDHSVFCATLEAAGVAGRVRHLRLYSDDAHGEVSGGIDLLYVDGAHRFGPARADLRTWGARVVPGGTLLVHDAFSSVGVTLAIAAELAAGRRFGYVGRTGSLAEFRSTADAHPTARARSAARLALEMPWFVRNLGLKVLLSVGPTHRLLARVARARGRRVPEWPY